MAKQNSAKPGCFSDFFHILFCTENGNSSPMHMHPSNLTTKPYAAEVVHTNEDSMVNETKPGVVARLMGIDSLPITSFQVPKENTNTLHSVPRSRSVNFADYLLKFDTSQVNQHQVKTSASFREVPALFQHRNHDLVVLYLDSEDNEVGSFWKKQEMGLGESRQRKMQVSKNKEIVAVAKERNRKKTLKFENEPRVVLVKHGSKVRHHKEAKVLAPVSACSKSCSNSRKGGSGSRSSLISPNKQKKVLSEPKHMKKTRKQKSTKRIESQCSSENFNQISVLDDYDCSFLYGPDFADYTSSLMSKKKWESSLFLGDNVGDRGSKDKGYLSELIVKLPNLTENDIRESDFTPKLMCEIESESYKEICLEYEHNIFDILLHEFVNELVELTC